MLIGWISGFAYRQHNWLHCSTAAQQHSSTATQQARKGGSTAAQ